MRRLFVGVMTTVLVVAPLRAAFADAAPTLLASDTGSDTATDTVTGTGSDTATATATATATGTGTGRNSVTTLEIALPDKPRLPPPVAVTPPIPVLSKAWSTTAADPLANRFIVLAAFGGAFMTIDGVGTNGMTIQPTLQRTFDRFELQTDLLLVDWNPRSNGGGHVLRLGAAARYQAARFRVSDLTLDAVLEAGAGWQRLMPDEGVVRNRADIEVGIGLRMLSRLLPNQASSASGARPIFFGVEAMVRLLVTPQRNAPNDVACVLAFGLPIGR